MDSIYMFDMRNQNSSNGIGAILQVMVSVLNQRSSSSFSQLSLAFLPTLWACHYSFEFHSSMTYSFIVNRTSLYLLRETKSETYISNGVLVFLLLYQHNCYTLSLNDGSLVPVFVHQSYPYYQYSESSQAHCATYACY